MLHPRPLWGHTKSVVTYIHGNTQLQDLNLACILLATVRYRMYCLFALNLNKYFNCHLMFDRLSTSSLFYNICGKRMLHVVTDGFLKGLLKCSLWPALCSPSRLQMSFCHTQPSHNSSLCPRVQKGKRLYLPHSLRSLYFFTKLLFLCL